MLLGRAMHRKGGENGAEVNPFPAQRGTVLNGERMSTRPQGASGSACREVISVALLGSFCGL